MLQSYNATLSSPRFSVSGNYSKIMEQVFRSAAEDRFHPLFRA